MTKFDQLLDALNTHAKALDKVTRRKKRWNRDHLQTALTLGSAILSGVAVGVPQVRPVAVVVEGLQKAGSALGEKRRLQAVTEEVAEQ